MIYRVPAAVAALFLLPANAPADPAAAFGARTSVESISLSPDGKRLAYVAPMAGQGSGLFTVDLATGQSQVTTSVDGAKQRLAGCNFVSANRFVCTVFVLVDHDGELERKSVL